ncbi:MAG: hypothetical protein Q9171_006626, partial [Xanthocarpia ochracea]
MHSLSSRFRPSSSVCGNEANVRAFPSLALIYAAGLEPSVEYSSQPQYEPNKLSQS